MLEDIIKYFSNFEKDKVLHFIMGILIYMWASLFMSYYGLGLVLLVAIFKEIFDTKGTGFSKKDIIATMLGGCVCLIYHILLAIII